MVPKTKAGKWSVGLGIALVISMLASLLLVFAIGGNPTVIESNALLSGFVFVLNLTLNLAGLLSLIVGIFTVVKYKDWSVFKPLAILYALVVLMFLLGEFLFPH